MIKRSVSRSTEENDEAIMEDAATDLQESLGEFMMPGGAGASKPVQMKKSNPVNTNPEITAPNACAECMGVGRGKDGAC
jgi:hypothetical protein